MSSLELARYLEILLETRDRLFTDSENIKIINTLLTKDGEEKQAINLVFKMLFNKTLDEIIINLKDNPKVLEYNHRSNIEILKETVEELRENYWRLNQILISKR